MNILITPSRLHGTVRIPASKSMAHRLLICAALAEGTSVISGVDMSRDITATMDVLSAFGASFRQEGSTITVTGVGNARPQAAVADCCESGSTLRFLIPVAAALGVHTTFFGQGRLPQRPITAYLRELTKKGITFDYHNTMPFTIDGKLRSGVFELEGDVSSQYVTGLLFALPLMFGNLLQQMYNIADTWVVGRFLGADALAAVGSSYTLMTFLTSILLGLCMGSGAAVSMQYGSGETGKMRQSVFQSFLLIAGIALVLNLLVYLGLNGILWLLRVPAGLCSLMKDYLLIIFLGIAATFLYNYFANLLRAIGNSVVPLAFLAVSAILNVILDLVCVLVLGWGVKGAAVATVFSQYVSGVGIGLYTLKKFPQLCPKRTDCRWDRKNLANILNLSVMTSVQQSIMNFGILMVQGLVNSFGTVIMAAFAAAVKIDSFAYMPVQDFGNAFSTYVAQNYGAGQPDRIKKGIRSAGLTSAVFCIVISVLVCAFAAPLMGVFIDPAQTGIIAAGVQYLRIEGACYIGIGVLFLLYGYYRAINQPGMSVILTIASLGTRVALAYLLSATPLGVTGIWLSVPIGWALADAIGIGYYLKKRT